MSKKNGYQIWASSNVGMEVKNPIWDNWKAEREMRYQQYQNDLKSELPSWMSEKLFMTIQRATREKIKKSLFKRIISFFKIK